MEILARFNQNKVDHSQDTNPHLVVTLTAPTLDWVEKRQRLCVLPVIDLSGSMDGAKLDYAKKSLLKLVDQLQPGDISGLVGFENRVHVLVKPAKVTRELKDQLKTAIRKLRVLGGTDLYGGYQAAIKLIQGLDLPPTYLRRAILFTDGQPTVGVTDTKQILKFVQKGNRGGISVSAFGYGNIGGDIWGGCDQDFLVALSKEAAGNYAYVQNPDDALSAFGKELGGLLSTYATNLSVEVEPVKGHQITKTVTDIKTEQDPLGLTEFEIPDILSEESRHFVFETRINKQDKTPPRSVAVFNVRVRYTVLTESGDQETKTSEAKARIQFGKAEEVEVVEEVDKIVSLHQMALAQREAEEKAKQGDYGGAAARMDLFSRDVRSKGYGSLADAAKSIESRVGSAQDYSNNAGFLRSMSYGSTRSFGLSASDGDAMATLSECNVTVGNSAMSETVARFTSDEAPAEEEPAEEDVRSIDALLGEAEAEHRQPITTGNNPLIWVTNSTSEK
jgi:Ca-activated chloride channel homolog